MNVLTDEQMLQLLNECINDITDLNNIASKLKTIKNSIISIQSEKSTNDTPISLTETEKNALNIILNKINFNDGIISISQLIEESNISRPVFKNLLLKLENNNIILVKNMGVKGTYIKLLCNIDFLQK